MSFADVILFGLQLICGSGSIYFAGNNAIKAAAISMSIAFIIGAIRSKVEKD
jgi:hypothetical protein